MRTMAGPGATVHFTHLSKSASASLDAVIAADSSTDPDALAAAQSHQLGVIALMEREGVPLERVCLLDPKAPEALAPEDGDGRFAWFLFGVSVPSRARRIEAGRPSSVV
jgi:ribosome biogenesis SPOUT family RNA methylase Rps3